MLGMNGITTQLTVESTVQRYNIGTHTSSLRPYYDASDTTLVWISSIPFYNIYPFFFSSFLSPLWTLELSYLSYWMATVGA